ncbi:MAG TPA: GNAT family N-acetyltransferase [Marmoricola sp.]|nr:GNAT family N-acetyltransferase [Marmoricola sp.]HNO39296.1 GNAT family N-acetyltransferase [Marmoricola sp.]
MTTMAGADADVRVLSRHDLTAAARVLGVRPVENVFVDYRARLTQMDPRWMGGQMWGFYRDGELTSMLHLGANLIPVEVDAQASQAFVARLRRKPDQVVTIVGSQDQVQPLWDGVKEYWPAPRLLRFDQPHLTITRSPLVSPDPGVRVTRKRDFEILYPACVAMYTEEIQVSPEREGGRELYRVRVQNLINRNWSFSRIENGRVLFKAEVACASQDACQIQGVYVDPEYRGRGLGTSGMAAVVQLCLENIAPTVALYVNNHNQAARRAYARVGFEQSDTFATVMY